MNRRAFLGSGLMSLFVGVFAVLMGGALPRPKQREGKAVTLDNSPLSAKDQAHIDSLDLTAAEAELGITPAPDHLRILKPWDGVALQECDPPTGKYIIGPITVRTERIDEMPPLALSFAESVSWDTPPKPTSLADMRRIHTPGTLTRAPGRQFGLG